MNGVFNGYIIWDNTQLTIFGGFAPNSDSANVLSKNLGDKTVMSGSVSKGRGDGSKSLQMMGRALMSPDELRLLPKGRFVVMKTGCHPIQTTLKLFRDWGITFADEYVQAEVEPRKVEYSGHKEIEAAIVERFSTPSRTLKIYGVMPLLIKRDIYALDLPHRAVAVYMYLCDRADDKGASFPSHKTIAGNLGLSVSTVKRALNDLERVGCLAKQARHRPCRGQTSNLYKV